MLKTDYLNATTGSKHTGVKTSLAEHQKTVAAEERHKNNVAARAAANNNPVNTNSIDPTAGRKRVSEADRNLAEARRKASELQSNIDKARTQGNQDKADSLQASAQNTTKQGLRNDLKQTDRGQSDLRLIEANNEWRNGNKLKAVAMKLKESGGRALNTFKKVLTRENVDADTIIDIYNEALENVDVWADILYMKDDEFFAAMESMTADELNALDHIVAIESAADIIDTILDAAESGDPDSDDILLEACAVFSEYGIDDAYSAILECAI